MARAFPLLSRLSTSTFSRSWRRGVSSTSTDHRSSKLRELDRLGTWDSRMEFELEKESSIRHGTLVPSISMSSIGVCSNSGRRTYQEDRYLICQPIKGLIMLAVFDGHGGDQCSQFCAERARPHLMHILEKDQNPDTANLEDVLTKLVLDLNLSFERHWNATAAKQENKPSPGTTATIALLRHGYELVIGHVGDSRAILCRDNEARQLTKDHCPSDPEEKARVKSLGGSVSYDTVGRHMVNKRLSMSRSIGDFDLKPYGVVADPMVIRINVKHGKDRYLALATDGISFVMSNDEIVECVNQCEKPSEAAEKLVDQALLFASEDNVTAIILPLGSWGKGQTAGTSAMYSLGRNMALSARFS